MMNQEQFKHAMQKRRHGVSGLKDWTVNGPSHPISETTPFVGLKNGISWYLKDQRMIEFPIIGQGDTSDQTAH
jgi:hypothetical protein